MCRDSVWFNYISEDLKGIQTSKYSQEVYIAILAVVTKEIKHTYVEFLCMSKAGCNFFNNTQFTGI